MTKNDIVCKYGKRVSEISSRLLELGETKLVENRPEWDALSIEFLACGEIVKQALKD